jgi:hypothetical protein
MSGPSGSHLRMPSAHASSSGPVSRVQVGDAVLLRGARRGQVLHEHLEQRVVRGQPLLHAALEQRLLAQLEVLLGERHAHRREHLGDGFVRLFHAILEDLGDRGEAEHAEGALEARGGLARRRLDPLLLLRVEVCAQAAATAMGRHAYATHNAQPSHATERRYASVRATWRMHPRRGGGGQRAQLSPHRRPIIFSTSTPNFLAYMRANLVSVKAQPCRPAEKATVPLVGSIWQSPSSSSLYVATSTLTFSTCLVKAMNMSSVGSCSSRKARSSLFTVTTGLRAKGCDGRARSSAVGRCGGEGACGGRSEQVLQRQDHAFEAPCAWGAGGRRCCAEQRCASARRVVARRLAWPSGRERALDALAEGLAQHRLGLHADALDAVHHNQRTVGDTQRGGHLRREVNVARGVDEVDQEISAVGILRDRDL